MTATTTYKIATAVIDLDALAYNYQTIRACAPNSKVLAVLKANAYGHGLERIAQALIKHDAPIDAFGVARIEEALDLRAAGIDHPIVLLEGFFSPEDVKILSENNLQTIVHNSMQLKAITQTRLESRLTVWLKVDTGMHRLGVAPEEFLSFYQALKASDNIAQTPIIISHLGCADDVNDSATFEQTALFEKLTTALTVKRSLANSAAICAFKNTHYDWVRPGLMLYGVSPLLGVDESRLALKPVMSLYSSLIAVRHIKAGESVGYGASWVSEKDTVIGVVAIGYGDGYPRHAQSGTPVLINQRIVPLVGRVSMDMITVDLGVDSADKVGDQVTLWGKGLPVAQIAQHATTIAYELLCNITRRVKMTVSD